MQLSGSFDPEAIARMQTAFDEALRSVPAEQRNTETKDALAKAILHYEGRGTRYPGYFLEARPEK
jgi:hypothetical protein